MSKKELINLLTNRELEVCAYWAKGNSWEEVSKITGFDFDFVCSVRDNVSDKLLAHDNFELFLKLKPLIDSDDIVGV